MSDPMVDQGAFMYAEILDSHELSALRLEFEKACSELHLGSDGPDKVVREHLALVMLSIAKDGESDASLIRIQAVDQIRRGT